MINPHLCPHKLNPRACLQCYNAPKPSAQAHTRQSSPVSQNHVGAPMAPLPGTKPAPVQGDRSGAEIGVLREGPRVSAEERARYRGEKPGAVQAPVAGAETVRREPYTSQRHDGAEYSVEKLWEPPAREQLIERLPSHPLAAKS